MDELLSRYKIDSVDSAIWALREIVQEIALLGLWRSKFFEHAAFYGGTALRILYGLDRFSEDLDFSLLAPHPDFKLDPYFSALEKELISFGFKPDISSIDKKAFSPIESAFIKMDTKPSILTIGLPGKIAIPIPANQKLKIKLEIDVDPPGDFSTEVKYQFLPHPYSIRAFALSSMFAGKLHALIARKWGKRVKGRDWYDFIWFVGKGVPVNLKHLISRLVQTGEITNHSERNEEHIRKLLQSRIEQVDIDQAKSDIRPFIADQSKTEVWSKEYFIEALNQIAFK